MTDSLDSIGQFISRYGFPVFVAVWLLWERLKIMGKLLGVLGRIEHRLERGDRSNDNT